MSAQLITNRDKLLTDVINNILPSSKKLFFLVGYFYFSGFKEIYKNLEDKEIKILIGLDIEKDFVNKIKEFEFIQNFNTSRGKAKENWKRSLVSLFNDSDYFDTEEKQIAFKLFLEKIKGGSLEIKKTLQPNHAKLYLFENKKEFNQGGEFPGTLITGSSNLTRSGLKGRQEINVVFRDNTFAEGKKLFENLWQEAIELVNKNNATEFLNDVIEKIWLDKLPKPFLLYVRVLEEYFSLEKNEIIKLPAEITKEKFLNLKYQIDAIAQSLEIIKKHSGVIISDVVGLGKSIIASAVAHNLRLKTIIICPPHLKEQWNDYRFDFDFNAKIYASGSIEKVLNEDINDEEKLIIVDESHKYRNEETGDYANLHKLCQGNKVILLTATPFNNRPQDIFSMIKLFQIPAKSTLQTVDNLSYQFKKLIKEYKDIQKSQKEKKETEEKIKQRIRQLAEQIRNILSPLVIRRSRLDLKAIDEYRKDLEKQKLEFPKVKDPKILEYDLADLTDLYKKTLEKIAPENEHGGFIGARYKSTIYLKDIDKYKEKITKEFGDTNLFKQAQINLAKFMRRLLVRRFESSVFAFKHSIDSIIYSSENIKDWYEKIGKVPIYKKGGLPDIEKLQEATGEDLDEDLEDINFDEQLKKYVDKGLQLIDKKELKVSFIKDLKKDISLLKEIRDEWFKNSVGKDPKLDYFTKTIQDQLSKDPTRKIIVFTEFADTANYLYDNLKNHLRVLKYTSADSSSTNKQTLKENFDAGYHKQKNDFDVLIATDAISEGYNLHRAGTIFNYDIPYNPTRVIQRVGRINRINKKVFDDLYIYNFFPTATGEKETRTKQISTLKIAMIHALLGEDTKVLTSDEELESFYRRGFRQALENQEELSWDVSYLNFLKNLKHSSAEVFKEVRDIPKRVRIKRTIKKNVKGVLVFGKKGGDYTFKLGISAEEYKSISPFEALKLFEADVSEKGEKVGKNFEAVYQNVKKNLFTKKTEVAYEKGKAEAISKIEKLKEKLPDKKDYFEDLLYVLKELDSLPERFAKKIRAISIEKLKEDVEDLQKIVTHHYLMEVREKADKIDEGEESLILSEELI